MTHNRHNEPKLVPRLVAIVGGSGAGKSWLSNRLQKAFGKESAVISLDSFYRDRSHLSAVRRMRINFDHPRAIDWVELESVISALKKGRAVRVPLYDFATHCRQPGKRVVAKKRIIFFDGLWLLQRRSVDRAFDLTIFVDCPDQLRRSRRVSRDTKDRGRTVASVCDQFDQCVAPMHDRHVAPQKSKADVVLPSPISKQRIAALINDIKKLLAS